MLVAFLQFASRSFPQCVAGYCPHMQYPGHLKSPIRSALVANRPVAKPSTSAAEHFQACLEISRISKRVERHSTWDAWLSWKGNPITAREESGEGRVE